MILLKNVLVATDFSDSSAVALRYGRDLTRTFGATLHVLHVAENLLARYATEFTFVDFPDIQGSLEEGARQRLDALVDAEDRRDLRAKAEIRTAAMPATAIADYAREHHIDLIVIGTHGRSGLAHVLLGSVAERVVRTAPCPVLTVRTPEREFVQPDALATTQRA